MNWIKSIFRWLGAGSPKKPNVTGVHEAMGCLDAFQIIYEKGGRAQHSVKWSPVHYIHYDPASKCFREKDEAYGNDFINRWDMTPEELNEWFSRNRTHEYVDAAWVILPESKK